MTSKVVIILAAVTIRRDANTIIPATVAPYELPILRDAFGEENVTETGPAHDFEVDAASEHERLSAKYGAKRVQDVFGKDKSRIAELVAKAAVGSSQSEKPAKKSSKKSSKKDPE